MITTNGKGRFVTIIMKIQTIIFSRDRALQLDGLINSFFYHCEDPELTEITVIYKATNSLHQSQYKSLKKYYKNLGISFLKEENLHKEVMKTVCKELPDGLLHRTLFKTNSINYRISLLLSNLLSHLRFMGHTLFLVDDTLFVRKFSLLEARTQLTNSRKALGFSLRLGANTKHNYPKNLAQSIPKFNSTSSRVIEFNWTKSSFDFGYPLEISSSLYRDEEIIPLLFKIPFNTPNELEWKMSIRAKKYRKKLPMLLSYKTSVAFSIPINRVQPAKKNRSGSSPRYNPQNLSELFSLGIRIDVPAYSGYVPNACHEEVELFFTDPKLTKPNVR